MILLPTQADVLHLKDFQPISLVGFFAKLTIKILSMRLAPKMHEIVSLSQTAFIKGRSIHDNFIYVQSQAQWFQQQTSLALC
jgi:predicted ribonuclease YlaK